MTDVELDQMEEKIKNGTATTEELTAFFKEFNSLLKRVNAEVDKIIEKQD